MAKSAVRKTTMDITAVPKSMVCRIKDHILYKVRISAQYADLVKLAGLLVIDLTTSS